MGNNIKNCLECQKNQFWVEIRLVDELNKPFSSLTGTLKDATGNIHAVTLTGGYLLLTDLPAGPVELKLETKALLTEAKKHKPRTMPQTSPAKEYADKNKGYQKSKIKYQYITLGDVWMNNPDMPKEHQTGATGTTLKLATKNSYVGEIKCFSYQEQHVAVVGTQHDRNVANKMTFAAQAIRTLKEKSGGKRKLIIFTSYYSVAQLEAIKKSTDKHNIEYKEMQSVSDLFSESNRICQYINPLQSLTFFCHGLPGSLELGYHLPSATDMALTLSNFKKIKSSIFAKNGRIDSYACRTGMGNLQDHDIENIVQIDPQPESSLAQKMADYFFVPVGAYVHRSSYEDTWGSVDERRNYQYLSMRGKKDNWTYKYFYEKLQEREKYVKDIHACYQIDGALNPVHADIDPVTDNIYNGRLEFLPK